MATPRFTDSEPAFSLFPFLSVMVGVIGIMAMIISAMSVLGLQDTDQIAQIIELEHDKQTDKQPVFVECRRDGLLLHPQRTLVPQEQIVSEQSDWYRSLLDLFANRDRQYLVLLVRPDGVESFRRSLGMARAMEKARTTKIDVGWDPVYAMGEIRFRQPERSRP